MILIHSLPDNLRKVAGKLCKELVAFQECVASKNSHRNESTEVTKSIKMLCTSSFLYTNTLICDIELRNER